ncbi:hypothetical protein K7432_004297 [Basidiobolus ranarum]|uniref:GBD/FH3 domain-containing protein n=1 Tax=Basidiobolus ranarum TaxID=34480 RepID=A0ABR2W4U4_9FUNG
MATPIRDEDVPRLFEELLNEMGLDDSKKAPLRMLSVQHKKNMLTAQKDLKAQDARNRRSGRFDSMPEFYIRKLTEVDVRYLSVKDLSSLRVSLTTQSLTWVNQFIQSKGLRLLSNILVSLSHKQKRSNSDNQIEHEVVRCLKALFNTKCGIQDALNQPRSVTNLCFSLDSPLLSTRKLVVEVMIFLCHYELPVGLNHVLKGIQTVEQARKEYEPFEAWLRPFESTIDGRGRMGSLSSSIQHNDHDIVDYTLSNLILLNSIVGNCSEIELRIHIRTQMNAAGLRRVIRKVKTFSSEAINLQVSKYLFEAEQDLLYLMDEHPAEVDDSSSIMAPSLPDTSDPLALFQMLLSSVEHTPCYNHFLSILQHMIMIPSDPITKQKFYKLIDKLVMQIILDDSGMPQDLSSVYGVSVGNILSRFGNEDKIDELQEELKNARVEAAEANKKRTDIEMELGMINDGLFGNMKTRIASLEDMLVMSRNTVELQKSQIIQLTEELERMKSGNSGVQHTALPLLAFPTAFSFPNPEDYMPSSNHQNSGVTPQDTSENYWGSSIVSMPKPDLIYNAGPTNFSNNDGNSGPTSPLYTTSFPQLGGGSSEASLPIVPPESPYSSTFPHYTGGLSPVSPASHTDFPGQYHNSPYHSNTSPVAPVAPVAYEPIGSGYASDYYGGHGGAPPMPYIPQIGGYPFPTLPNQSYDYNRYDWNPPYNPNSYDNYGPPPPMPQPGQQFPGHYLPSIDSRISAGTSEMPYYDPMSPSLPLPLPPRPPTKTQPDSQTEVSLDQHGVLPENPNEMSQSHNSTPDVLKPPSESQIPPTPLPESSDIAPPPPPPPLIDLLSRKLTFIVLSRCKQTNM